MNRLSPTSDCKRHEDHTMTQTTDMSTPSLLCGEAGYDPIEDRLRQNIRAIIEALFKEELAAIIGRCRYDRGGGSKKTIGTGIASVSSPTHSERKRSACRGPGLRTRRARPWNGGRRRSRNEGLVELDHSRQPSGDDFSEMAEIMRWRWRCRRKACKAGLSTQPCIPHG